MLDHQRLAYTYRIAALLMAYGLWLMAADRWWL